MAARKRRNPVARLKTKGDCPFCGNKSAVVMDDGSKSPSGSPWLRCARCRMPYKWSGWSKSKVGPWGDERDWIAAHKRRNPRLRSTVSEAFARVMADSYVRTALWASTDDDDEPLDKHYDARHVSKRTKVRVLRECRRFLVNAQDDATAENANKMGHDFFLTRNGHGAGFWDRGLGAAGDRLTKLAKAFRNDDWYVGDDGQVYGSGD